MQNDTTTTENAKRIAEGVASLARIKAERKAMTTTTKYTASQKEWLANHMQTASAIAYRAAQAYGELITEGMEKEAKMFGRIEAMASKHAMRLRKLAGN